MSDFELTIGEHPSRARHPNTGQTMLGVPLFPDARGIYLDGVCIGYVSSPAEGRNIGLTSPVKLLGQVIVAELRSLVESELGPVGGLAAPPEPTETDDDDPEYEDEE